jgi:glycopeptide antibiotics resistance protein
VKIKPVFALIWLACIAYAGFIPFHVRPLDFFDALVLFRQIPLLDLGAGSRADWVANILLYIPLGFLLTGAVQGQSSSFFKNSLVLGAVFFSCLVAAVLIEFFQLFFSPRTVSVNDLIAEGIGSGVGIFLWAGFGDRLLRALQVLKNGGRHAPGAEGPHHRFWGDPGRPVAARPVRDLCGAGHRGGG